MRSCNKIIILVLSALQAAGCSVYRDYERGQAAAVADSLYTSPDTTTIADIGWREIFTDTLLQNLIETGLRNNADVLVARQRVLQAKASLKAAELAFLPSIGLSPSASFSRSEERYGGSAESYSVPLSGSWELDFSGKILVGRRKAQAALEENEVLLRSIKTELVASIAGMYFTLEMLDEKLDISKRTAKSWQENVRIMKSMKQAGMTNEASVSQTEANACSIEASLYDLEYQIAQVENELAALLGVTPQKFKRGSIRGKTIPIPLSTGIPAQLLSKRPDVMAAELELRKCFYDKALANAAFYPGITLNGELGWEKALTSPAGWLFSAGAGLTQPIFRRGSLKENLKVAESREKEAEIRFRQTILKAGAEVNNAIAKCRSVQAKENIRSRQIEALQSAEKSTEALMRHSESTYLEVLTAQQSLLSARLQQVSDHYDSLSGLIDLYRALGGGGTEQDRKAEGLNQD